MECQLRFLSLVTKPTWRTPPDPRPPPPRLPRRAPCRRRAAGVSLQVKIFQLPQQRLQYFPRLLNNPADLRPQPGNVIKI